MRSVNPLTRSDTLTAASHSPVTHSAGSCDVFSTSSSSTGMGGIGAWTNWSRNPTRCRRPYAWAAHHLESIPKEERPRVAKDVPGQEQIHLPVRCPGGAHAHGLHNATDHAILIIAVGMAFAQDPPRAQGAPPRAVTQLSHMSSYLGMAFRARQASPAGKPRLHNARAPVR
jgi:hypothetical protein